MEELLIQDDNLPHWFLPFLPYIVRMETENHLIGGTLILLGVDLEIPYGAYDWNGVDTEALVRQGVNHLSIEKIGIHYTNNLGLNAKEATGSFDHWYIKIGFSDTIFINEETCNLVNRWVLKR